MKNLHQGESVQISNQFATIYHYILHLPDAIQTNISCCLCKEKICKGISLISNPLPDINYRFCLLMVLPVLVIFVDVWNLW